MSALWAAAQNFEVDIYVPEVDVSTPEHKHDTIQDKVSGVEVSCSV